MPESDEGDTNEGGESDADAFGSDAFESDEELVPSRAVDRFRRGTVVGAMLQGAALALREVLEPEREQAPIIQVAPGDPDHPQPVDADLDPDDPSASTVTVRPWLMDAPENEGNDDE